MTRSTNAILTALLSLLLMGCSSSASPPGNASGGSAAAQTAAIVTKGVKASGALQQCLGITPGADRMTKGQQTRAYCDQLPAASIYNQAGARFQAGDHAGAAQILGKAAEAGNAVAQLRLALMFDQGDGVPKDWKQAYLWYSRAAAQGEPESLNQVGLFHELAEGVGENWDLAAELWKASAEQGWMKGQFSYGRAFQFGIGVPQNRQMAIAWFAKAGRQGDPNGTHWAQWLSNPTNNIGFRDGAEHDFVMGPYLRFGSSLMGGDPAGITFHNSGQRGLWIKGYSQRIAKDEQDVMRRMHEMELQSCLASGGECGALRF